MHAAIQSSQVWELLTMGIYELAERPDVDIGRQDGDAIYDLTRSKPGIVTPPVIELIPVIRSPTDTGALT